MTDRPSLKETLARLDKLAAQGLWIVDGSDIRRIADGNPGDAFANAAFPATLVNAYRTGQLVERDGVVGELTDKQLSEIGQQIAGKSPWGKRTANYGRIYQGAVLGAIAAITAIKGGDDAA